MWEAKRWLARHDLFFLLTVICRRADLNHDWLFARCREVQANPDGYLDLWAREHYKSTIITFGKSLQDILASHGDGSESRYGREITIGIFSHTRPAAKGYLRQIKYECEQNNQLIGLFPDILWADPNDAPKWSEDEGLIFRRQSNPKEATVEAWGLVDGQPTGKHFTIRVYDDVVTERSVTSDMIRKTTAAWELSENLGIEGGVARYIGSRYHLADTYATMIDRGIPTRIHPCTSDGSEDFSKSVLRSADFLASRRRLQGPYTFGAQMLLDPRADNAQGFRAEWLRYWPAQNTSNLNLYIVVDPASKKKEGRDYTAMWVIGIGGDGNYYIVDGVWGRLNLVERTKALFKLHRQYDVIGVGYEEYGLQADIEHIQYVMERQNYRFGVTALAGPLTKLDRIRRLIPLFEQGRIFLPPSIIYVTPERESIDLVRTFITHEYHTFPVSDHDDMLDALARILDDRLAIVKPRTDRNLAPKWMEDAADEGVLSWLTA